MKDILIDTSLDVLKMLPYLFAAFVLIEVLEMPARLLIVKQHNTAVGS